MAHIIWAEIQGQYSDRHAPASVKTLDAGSSPARHSKNINYPGTTTVNPENLQSSLPNS